MKMRAILIEFPVNSNIEVSKSLFSSFKTEEKRDRKFAEILHGVVSDLTNADEEDMSITLLSERDWEASVCRHATEFLLKPEPRKSPMYVELTRFLDNMKDEFGNLDSTFATLEIIKHRTRSDIEEGLILCKSFEKASRIPANRRAFKSYVNHLSNEESDALINFIILLSKI